MESALDEATVRQVAALLLAADSALFITGAGISADSGLPTYRGVGGLYDRDDTDDGVPIEVALSGAMFRRQPELTWKYIAQIEAACRGARPNRAHQIIAELERRMSRVWVLTQNVDSFHRDAGSTQVIEIHGSTRDLLCPDCPWRDAVADYSQLVIPPRCPRCDAVIRPDVVLFGEMLPTGKLALLADQLGAGFDIVFTIGTTSVFPYIAQPIWQAASTGTPTVEINPGASEVSGMVSHRLRVGASAAMQAIWAAYEAGLAARRRP